MNKIVIIIFVVLLGIGVTSIFLDREFKSNNNTSINLYDPDLAKVELVLLSSETKEQGLGRKDCYPRFRALAEKTVIGTKDPHAALEIMSDRLCSSGYLHGVMATLVGQNIYSVGESSTFCNEIRLDIPVESDWKYRHCVQGIGRGLIDLHAGNLDLAIKECLRMDYAAIQKDCTEGVYSEYFSSEFYTDSMNLDTTFDMCSKRPQYDKGICASLSVDYFLSTDSVQEEGVFSWCKEAGKSTGFCIFAAAHRLAENNITDLKKVETLCEKVEPDMLPSCIEGLSRGVAGYYGGLTEAKTVCNSVLKEKNRQFCPDILK